MSDLENIFESFEGKKEELINPNEDTLTYYKNELATAKAEGSQIKINFYNHMISLHENLTRELAAEFGEIPKETTVSKTYSGVTDNKALHQKGDMISETDNHDVYRKNLSFGSSAYEQRNNAASEYNKNGESSSYKSQIKETTYTGPKDYQGKTESQYKFEASKTGDPEKKKELLEDAAKAKANHDIWMKNTYEK